MENSKIGSSSKANKPSAVDLGATSTDINNAEPATKKTRVEISQIENDIFYNENYLSEKQRSIKFKPKITEVDEKKFKSLENFQTFITDTEDNFLEIKDEFIADINKFKDLCLFYVSDSDKSQFEYEINQLKSNIEDINRYETHEYSIVTLFRDIRPQISVINQILNQIKSEKTAASPELDVDQVKNLIYAHVLNEMGVCLDGVSSRINSLQGALLVRIESKETLIHRTKQELLDTSAQDYENDLTNLGEIKTHTGMNIHRINALKNAVAINLAMKEIYDGQIKYSTLTAEHLAKFLQNAKVNMLPINIVTYLADNAYNLFFNAIQEHNCSDVLTEQGMDEDEINEGFTGNIERLIKEFNALYGDTKNQITFFDISEYLEVADKNHIKIENLETKLHAYISRSFLPENTQRIVVDISHHDFFSDNELKIASIANCYFGIIEARNQQQNIFADINIQTNLQLKHITSNFIKENQLPVETYQPLIIQALKQTNNHEEIIAFFLNDNIKELLQEDQNSGFKTYLLKIITNKIEGDLKLKQQLVEKLCTDPRVIAPHNSLNIENTYWITNTPLLEPLLLELAKQGVNISHYIEREFTITDILNLEHRDSLKTLCETSKNKITNTTRFKQQFEYLMVNDSSNAIATLACSGLVDELLTKKEYNQLLISLAKRNSYSAIKLILEMTSKLAADNNLDLNIVDSGGNTLLMYVSKIGDSDLLKMLIKQGADVNKQNKNGLTALMLTARYGWKECMQQLIANNADIEIKDNTGQTALMFAARSRYSNEDCLKILINSEAIIDAKNNHGSTALMYATKLGNYKSMELLINKRADVNAADNNNITVLHYLSENPNTECLQILLNNNVNLNVINIYENTPLIVAVSLKDEHYDYIKMLLKKGANPNIKNNEGLTALMFAAMHGKEKSLMELIDNNADLYLETNKKETILHYVAHNGSPECLNIVLDKYIDLDLDLDAQENMHGSTALMLAVMQGHQATVNTLLKRGANPNILNVKGENALMLAKDSEIIKALLPHTTNLINVLFNLAHKDDYESIKLILEFNSELAPDKKIDLNAKNYAGNTLLMYASKVEDTNLLEMLINQKADVNGKNSEKSTALMIAAQYGNKECMELLLTHEAHVNESNMKGQTPLMFAAKQGDKESVNTLLRHHANVNEKNINGYTALMVAKNSEIIKALLPHTTNLNDILFNLAQLFDYKRIQVILQLHNELFPENNLDLNFKDSEGNTLLMYVSVRSDTDLIEILINNGADVNEKNINGYTALIYAIGNGNQECVNTLLRHHANVNEENIAGNTALMLAVTRADKECVNTLLKSGATPNIINSKGGNALTITKNTEIIKILLPYTTNLSEILFTLAQQANYAHLQVILELHNELFPENNLDLNSKDINHNTLLMYVSKIGDSNLLKMLLNQGALVNEKNLDGNTALIFATENRNQECVDILREHGALE